MSALAFSADAQRFSGPYAKSGKVGKWELTCRVLNRQRAQGLAQGSARESQP